MASSIGKQFTVALGVIFLCLVFWLLWERLTELDWPVVLDSLQSTPAFILLMCVCWTGVSYSVFFMYDWLSLSKHQCVHAMSHVLFPAFISYAVNHNLGALLGSVGMRLKLYTDLGITPKEIARVLAVAAVGNWAGYWVVAGVFLVIFPDAMDYLPLTRAIPWRLFGIAMLLALPLIIGIGLRYKHFLSGVYAYLPGSPKESAWRLALAIMNWLAMVAIMFSIFSIRFNAPWTTVMSAFLVSAMAGVITHIPAGVGVYEYVFLLALTPTIGSEAVISGMLTFRAVYYLLPMLLSLLMLVWFKLKILPDLAAQ